MIQFLRVLALVLLILVTVVNPKYYRFTIEKEWLYIISVSILIVLILLDGVVGTLFLMTLIAAYIKLYDIRFAPIAKKNKDSGKMLEDITPEHLRKAQNNVVDESTPDYKGIDGTGVYTAQGSGTDDVSGFHPYESLTGAQF